MGKYTSVEESRAEWKFVEAILPQTKSSEPPTHDQYPTASGWFPPTATPDSHPYFIRRTRWHNFPIYKEIRDGGTRKITVIKKVEGDMWALDADLRHFISPTEPKKVITQVDEVQQKLRIRGTHLDTVSEFLKEKGF